VHDYVTYRKTARRDTAGVDVKINGQEVTVKGPKGTLSETFHKNMKIVKEGNAIIVTRPNDEKENRSLHGLTAHSSTT
jgi:large subunit ribosomal protein L6